jgi:hypothetical protein
MALGLERTLASVAVVLRRLDDTGAFGGEGRHEVAQPARLHHVVGVDDRNDFGARVGVAQREIERARLEARQRVDMEETESRTEPPAVLLDGEPHQRVDGVVVDDQDFEVVKANFCSRSAS